MDSCRFPSNSAVSGSVTFSVTDRLSSPTTIVKSGLSMSAGEQRRRKKEEKTLMWQFAVLSFEHWQGRANRPVCWVLQCDMSALAAPTTRARLSYWGCMIEHTEPSSWVVLFMCFKLRQMYWHSLLFNSQNDLPSFLSTCLPALPPTCPSACCWLDKSASKPQVGQYL